jgi:hypothetical protein
MHRTWVSSYRAALALMLVLLFGWAPLAHAGGRGGGHGFHGGRGSGSHGGVHGHSGGRFHGHGHHGFRGHHGFKHHGGFHHHHKFHGKAFIGVAPFFLLGPSFIHTPPVIVERAPVYVQPSGFWYYCRSAGAYYPYVETCPEPWVPVPAR